MNRSLLGALGLASSMLVIGCDGDYTYKKKSKSPLLNEDALVTQTIYQPSSHGKGSGSTYTFGKNGGLGYTSVDVTIPEKYAVVFRCQHGKFIVESEGDKYKSLWERVNEGDLVDVSYTEIYQDEFSHKKGQDRSNDELIKRTLVKYDFIDAQIKEVTKEEKDRISSFIKESSPDK